MLAVNFVDGGKLVNFFMFTHSIKPDFCGQTVLSEIFCDHFGNKTSFNYKQQRPFAIYT